MDKIHIFQFKNSIGDLTFRQALGYFQCPRGGGKAFFKPNFLQPPIIKLGDFLKNVLFRR